jgi:hypothetical protein
MPSSYTKHFGRIEDKRETEKLVSQLMRPLFGLAANHLQDVGKGKDVFLWKAEEAVLGHWLPPHAQTIGDCVSHGFGGALDTLRCVRIAYQGMNESFIETATEPLYGGSRVEIGGGRINGDGSIGAWALEFILKYGILVRKVYDKLDFTKYNGRLARELGKSGIPTSLEATARESPLKEGSLITSYDQARDAIGGAKCPIPVCSNYGFEPRGGFTRESNGFIKPGGTWPHCMYFLGVTDNPKRPGLACRQSWGKNAPAGPKRVTLPHGLEIDIPDGVFFIDADVCDKMLRGQDSFVLADMVGYPARDFNFQVY